MIPDVIAAHEPNDAPTVICQARDFLLKGEWVNWFFYVGEWEALITLQLKYFDEKYLRVCRLTWNDELNVIPNLPHSPDTETWLILTRDGAPWPLPRATLLPVHYYPLPSLCRLCLLKHEGVLEIIKSPVTLETRTCKFMKFVRLEWRVSLYRRSGLGLWQEIN